ncbi:MAG: SDR family oxidoreductase [Bdellovibrionaceae bacterium]|nr:SDR family oxidoreductase [Pseudobdellovibrionaceae bacterium]MBX3033500.1 SDR family oxidoreductase [Pseudobdellovibrionaceae bacterium]
MSWWSRFFPQKEQYFRPVILVTGASSGIGLALAKRLMLETRYRIVITAREGSIERLRGILPEGDRFWIHALDVTDEEQRQRLVRDIDERWGGVNVLVNNAGISYRAVVEDMTDEDERRQMATNYFGPMGLIRLVLPNMRERGRGKIINISSVSGMMAMPTMASYSASKYALEGASEALWYETKPFGIDVVLVQPGFIRSRSFENVYYTEKSKPEVSFEGPYQDYYRNMIPFVGRMMNRAWATPDSVANLVLKAIKAQNPPLWIPATIDASVFYYLRRLLPRRLLLPALFYLLPKARTWGRRFTNKRLT